MKKIALLIVIVLAILCYCKVYAAPVALDKMICHPVSVAVIEAFDTEEIMTKTVAVYTNNKSASDITLYRCDTTRGEICYMRLKTNKEPELLSCFKQ